MLHMSQVWMISLQTPSFFWSRDVFSLHFDDFEDVEKVKLSVQRLAALLQVVENEFMNLLHSFCKIHNVIFRNVFLQAFAKLRKCCSCYKLAQLMAFFYSFGNMVEDSKFSFPFVPKSFKSTLILSGRSWLSSGCFAWNTRRDDAGKMQDTKMKRCKGAKMPNFLVLNAPTRWIHHSLKMSWNDLIDHFPISSIREGFHVQMFPKYKHCLNFWPCLITRLREFIYISSRHDASISWSPVHNTLEFHYCSLHWSFVFEEVLKWRHRGEICFDSAASFSTREASFVSLNLVLWTCIADFLCFFPCFFAYSLWFL